MKKVISIAICIMMFILPLTVNAQSQSSSSAGTAVKVEEISVETMPAFGQDHSYSVTFRGNMDSVVTLRTAFSNLDSSPKSVMTLRVPSGTPQDLIAFQLIREKRCSFYEPQAHDELTGRSFPQTPKCLEYQEPNYYDYWSDKTKYLRASVTQEGDKINITLPQPIEPNKSGSYVLYFRSQGYVSKSFGGSFDYKFETLRIDEPIRAQNVGINTDTGLVLKGANTEVNYAGENFSPVIQTLASSDKSTIMSPEMDSYISQIGQGTITKYGKYLQPNDTLTVEGSYAKSIFSLYSKEIAIGLGTIFGILLLISFSIYFVSKRAGKTENKETTPQSETQKGSTAITFLWILILGFITSIFAAGYTVVLYFVSRALEYYVYYEYKSLVMILVSVFSFAFYALILLIPTVVVALKKGYKWAAILFGVTFVWIILYTFLALIFVLSGLGKNYYQDPMPIPLPEIRNDLGEPAYMEATPAMESAPGPATETIETDSVKTMEEGQ